MTDIIHLIFLTKLFAHLLFSLVPVKSVIYQSEVGMSGFENHC